MHEQWQNELQEENFSLSYTLVELYAELQKATDEIQQRDQPIDSLRCELPALKNRLGETSGGRGKYEKER